MNGRPTELEELGEYFAAPYKMEVFRPDPETRRRLQDGGAAAVEQIICSRARHFIGSHESTFSLRIHEEREILGFPPESTFNRFCYDGQTDCEQPARWRIVFWFANVSIQMFLFSNTLLQWRLAAVYEMRVLYLFFLPTNFSRDWLAGHDYVLFHASNDKKISFCWLSI